MNHLVVGSQSQFEGLSEEELEELNRTERESGGLSNEQLVELARTDDQVIDQILSKNKGFVVYMAKKYESRLSNSVFTRDDLIQEGSIAICNAVKKYNPNGNGKFSTYAGNLIKWRILRFIADNAATIRLPVYLQDDIRKVTNGFSALGLTDYEDEDSIIKVARHIGKTPAFVRSRLAYNDIRTLSLDTPIQEESDATHADNIADDNPTPDETTFESSNHEAIRTIINSYLSERESDIVKRLTGFDCERETLEDIGKSYGISKARVHSIKTKCFDKLSRIPELKELLSA